MNLVVRTPGMSREQFLKWAQGQEGRHEFDGFQPVAMTGGTVNHDQIIQNVMAALRSRLKGHPCRALGNVGVATVGDIVRYPDALVTCATVAGADVLVPGVVVVFEVVSLGSGRTDRIEKLREYREVGSIRRYTILEHRSVAATAFGRMNAGENWTAKPLVAQDIIELPEIGIGLHVAELYEGVDLPAAL